MKKQISLIIAGCLLSTTLLAENADFRQKLVGTWDFAATNTTPADATQTMSTETTYHADGTFSMTGVIGMSYPTNSNTLTIRNTPNPFSRTIGGSGIWHVEQGCLYTTTTNSATKKNIDHCDEIVTLNEHQFTYRVKAGQLQGEVRTATRK